MRPLRNLLLSSPDFKKTQSKKTEKNYNKDFTKKYADTKASVMNPVKIPDLTREALTLQIKASNYLKDVNDSEVVSQREFENIKDKIASKYYFDPEVIDDLLDKLISLPDFVKGPDL